MIGYYVHHHGRGHLSRAACVAAVPGEPVVALSSLPEPASHPFAEWIALPPDPPLSGAADPSAGGTMHWAPLGAPDYRDRMAAVADWVARARPRLVVVDVSVEVTALVRLMGTPVVVVAGPGERDDVAHRTARAMAVRHLAPWPDLGHPAHSTVHVGAFSRFDDRVARPASGSRRVLVLLGAGGADLTSEQLADAASATPRWSWRRLGGAGDWVEDVWDELQAADVVVTHAGLGALAEVAAARRPAIVLPQPRPFGEQIATGRLVARAGLAQVCAKWPSPYRWPSLLDEAVARGGAGWARWNDGQGARRFVDEVRTVDLPGHEKHSAVA